MNQNVGGCKVSLRIFSRRPLEGMRSFFRKVRLRCQTPSEKKVRSTIRRNDLESLARSGFSIYRAIQRQKHETLIDVCHDKLRMKRDGLLEFGASFLCLIVA